MIEVARTPLGRIALEPKALSRLVRDAAASVEGVRPAGTPDVSVAEDGAATVAVTVAAPRRAVLPELGALVQQRIAEGLRLALDAPPARIDVTIEGIQAEDEG